MTGAPAANVLTVAGRRLEIVTIPMDPERTPIVMLHEGLGSVSAWRAFPLELARRTQRSIIVYSRYGHGASEALAGPRDVRYMHDEAELVLPALLAALDISAPILFGHSDGASIALIYAGRFPTGLRALVLEAPHVFVEPLTTASISRMKQTLATSGLIDKLARHHAQPWTTFWGWNDIWLDPAFAGWNITEYLPAIAVPTLLIQGRDDEYGTVAQAEAIARAVPHTQTLLFEHSGHSPHRVHEDAVLARTASFLSGLE
jgi:pimeloyl-ACP methyl ester carboxylesterase